MKTMLILTSPNIMVRGVKLFAGFMFIVLNLSACSKVNNQLNIDVLHGISKPSIENYSEVERQPILQYLSEARVVSDNTVEKMSKGQALEVLNEIKQVRGPIIDFEALNKRLLNTFGIIKSYEYRAQAIEMTDAHGDVHDLVNNVSSVTYLVKATKWNRDNLFFTVKTKRINGVHKVFQVIFMDYSSSVPDWLRTVDYKFHS